MKRIRSTLLVASSVALVCSAALTAMAGEETIEMADAPGRDITVASCAMCHSLDYVSMNAPVMTRTGWEKTVRKMVDKFGAPVSAENMQLILDYLTLHYSAAP
jgi:cytochrome c5